MNMQNFEYNTINIQVDLARHFMTVNTNVITLDEVMESLRATRVSVQRDYNRLPFSQKELLKLKCPEILEFLIPEKEIRCR